MATVTTSIGQGTTHSESVTISSVVALPASSAVAAWTMDESSGTRSDSVGANDLTDNNTVLSTTGKHGNAASFDDGTDESLDIADNTDLSMTDQDFAVAVWMQRNGNFVAPFVSKWGAAGNREYRLIWDVFNERFTWSVSDDGTTVTSVNLAYSGSNEWVLIHVWHDATANQIGISMNAGTPATTSTSAGVHDGNTNFQVGGANSDSTNFFGGLVDELIVIKNAVFSSAERTFHYNGGAGLAFADWTNYYKVVLSAAVPASVVVGDAFFDEAATPNKYLITAISGSELIVRDTEGVGAAPDDTSASSTPAITRYYNGSTPITDWEGDLDDTGLYTSGDDAVGECYNDAAFDETWTINGGGTVGLGSITLTVASGERHDGTEGTGARVVRTSTGSICTIAISNVDFSWFELDGNGQTMSQGSYASIGGVISQTHLIVHGCRAAAVSFVAGIESLTASPFTNGNTIHDNIVYDIGTTGRFQAVGIYLSRVDNVVETVYNNVTDNVFITGTGASDIAYGIYCASNNAAKTLRNNIATRAVNNGTGQQGGVNFTGSTATNSYNATDDGTADDYGDTTNSLVDIVTANQFTNISAGFEDYHLKTGADVIDVGVDLNTTPTGVNIDIDGNDREGMVGNWDIGAHQYYADYDKVVTTIGAGTTHNENVNITATAGSGPYLVTLASSSGAVRGDALYDEAGTPNKYRIIEVSGTSVSVVDSEGVGAAPDSSATSTPTVQRYYNGSTPVTDWEVEIVANSSLYPDNGYVVGECYNDASFNDPVSISAVAGFTEILLTVATGERHDGTAGTGARQIYTAAGSKITMFSVSALPDRWVEWLELDLNSTRATDGSINMTGNGVHDQTAIRGLRNLLVHEYDGQGADSPSNGGFILHIYDTPIYILNCIFYNHDYNVAGNKPAIKLADVGDASQIIIVENVTLHDVDNAAATGGSLGLQIENNVATVRNVVVSDVTGGTGTIACFSGTSGTHDYNASTDSTAVGSNSLTSISSSNQYVSTTVGMEDLHLKSGADCIDEGTDLGTTPTGVNIDIDGNNRDSLGVIWDIGAHEFIATLLEKFGILTSGTMNFVRSIKIGGQL